MKTGSLALALLLSLAACGRDEPVATNQATDTITTSPATADTQFDPKEARATVPPDAVALVQKDVQVTLDDSTIEMTPTLPASQVTFNVSNTGSQEHSFQIAGAGVDRKLDRPLQPGQSSKLVVDLRAGTYKVYCPVGDHEQRGITRSVVVH